MTLFWKSGTHQYFAQGLRSALIWLWWDGTKTRIKTRKTTKQKYKDDDLIVYYTLCRLEFIGSISIKGQSYFLWPPLHILIMIITYVHINPVKSHDQQWSEVHQLTFYILNDVLLHSRPQLTTTNNTKQFPVPCMCSIFLQSNNHINLYLYRTIVFRSTLQFTGHT